MILILSDPTGDVHVPPVTTELDRRGEEYCVYDPATFPGDSTITMKSGERGIDVVLSWDSNRLDLSAVKSIWYRRPGDFQLSRQLRPEEAEWVRSECDHFLRAVWQNTQCLWVSNPIAIRSASLKGVQLKLAQEMGFLVPSFTITNDVGRASEFIAQHPGGVIVKVLAKPGIRSGERVATLYTHLLKEEDLDHLSAVKNGPTFLQEYIDKSADIRVTVIGQAAYAVAIEPTREARVDFRKVEVYNLAHSIVQLPVGLSQLCIDLVGRLNLAFGAIDLALTPHGEYYFLEINPNGQWFWLEYMTGVPLTNAMCDLLSRGNLSA